MDSPNKIVHEANSEELRTTRLSKTPVLETRPTVCLNMIVKNESAVIRRCLGSLKHLIDHWVIVDTGSTDGTQEIIRNFLSHIPGELHERQWQNFGHNRTEALQLARNRADFCLIIDADEIISTGPDFTWAYLNQAPCFMLPFDDHGISYSRCQIISNQFEWSYKGVLHEYIHCKELVPIHHYPDIKIVRFLDGARSSDPHKFKKDALVLENALLEEPENSRYVFYLAQSYRDADEIDLALKYYRKRVDMGGWDQEVWFSLYQIAQLLFKQQQPWPEVQQAYLQAYEYYPKRAEPLFKIMLFHMYQTKAYQTAYIFGQAALKIEKPNDLLFLETEIYDWSLKLELAVCAFYIGEYATSIILNNQLLRKDLSGEIVHKLKLNRKYSLEKIYRGYPTQGNSQSIKVFVLFHNPGHWIDNCIEQCMKQNYPNAEYIFINNGSGDGSEAHVPISEPNFFLINREYSPQGYLVASILDDICSPEDIIYIIEGHNWMANQRTLTMIDEAYRQRACELLYSQFDWDQGQPGLTLPLASQDDLDSFELQLYNPVSVSCQGKLMLNFLNTVDIEKLQATSNSYDIFISSLFQFAGFDRIQFTDEVWLICRGLENKEKEDAQ